jgi:hypothetical protein
VGCKAMGRLVREKLSVSETEGIEAGEG